MVDIDIVDDQGETALFKAYKNNDLNIFKRLLNMGIDITIKNNEGKTVMDVAHQEGNAEFVQVLKIKKNVPDYQFTLPDLPTEN